MLCRLKVEGQTLCWYGGPEVLAADSVEFVGFEFILPEDWDGYTLHATFQQDDKAYTQVLEDRKCTLPSEIGVGNCEIGLFGYQPGKSPRATTNLLKVQVCQSGFVPNGEYPIPPTPDLYSQLLSHLDSQVDAAKTSADAAKADADRAAALAEEVFKKAAQTAQDASDTTKAMEAVQMAQRLAEKAQGAAETARTAAEAAQAAAETAVTDADGAKQAAEAAQKASQDAAAAAAKTLADIRALYQQMQEWAAGVIQTVNAAADSAGQSATSAAGSASAASEAQSAAETAQRGAETARDRAETAAIKQPYPNAETGTWWTWDADKASYVDSGEPYEGAALYATFDVDPATGKLCVFTPARYHGPEFALNEATGKLEVTVNG